MKAEATKTKTDRMKISNKKKVKVSGLIGCYVLTIVKLCGVTQVQTQPI